MSGLMRGGWKRGQVSDSSARRYCVDSAGHIKPPRQSPTLPCVHYRTVGLA